MSSLYLPCPFVSQWLAPGFVVLHCILPEKLASVVGALSDLYFLPPSPCADLVHLLSYWRVFSPFFIFHVFWLAVLVFSGCTLSCPPPLPWDSGWLWCMSCRDIPLPLPAVEEYSGCVHPCVVAEAPLGILHWVVCLLTFPLLLHVSFELSIFVDHFCVILSVRSSALVVSSVWNPHWGTVICILCKPSIVHTFGFGPLFFVCMDFSMQLCRVRY